MRAWRAATPVERVHSTPKRRSPAEETILFVTPLVLGGVTARDVLENETNVSENHQLVFSRYRSNRCLPIRRAAVTVRGIGSGAAEDHLSNEPTRIGERTPFTRLPSDSDDGETT